MRPDGAQRTPLTEPNIFGGSIVAYERNDDARAVRCIARPQSEARAACDQRPSALEAPVENGNVVALSQEVRRNARTHCARPKNRDALPVEHG